MTTVYCEAECKHRNGGVCGLDFITIVTGGECGGMNIDNVEG